MPTPLTNFVLQTLTDARIQSVHFRYGSFRVAPDDYRDVADLIRGGHIRVTTVASEAGMTARQAASTDGAFVVNTREGDTHPLFINPQFCEVGDGGTVYINQSLSDYERQTLRGTIAHEATHAVQDRRHADLSPRQAEGAGYLAGAITARRWGLVLPPPGQIADPWENRLLRGQGVALWIADRIFDRLGADCAIEDRDMGVLEDRVRVGGSGQYQFNGI